METTTCTDCSSHLGRPWYAFWDTNKYACDNGARSAVLCTQCHRQHPLFVVPAGAPVHDMDHATMRLYCKSCFETKSTVNFAETYTKIPGTSGTTIVFVHGGSGSRALFQAHAQELHQRFGHGAILLDLPGHASLVEKPLTLETCAEALGTVLDDSGVKKMTSSDKLVYFGGSLGAYIGFYLLERFKESFDGAVLIDCGQNVGPGASFQAKMGLVFLSFLGGQLSNAALLKMIGGCHQKVRGKLQDARDKLWCRYVV